MSAVLFALVRRSNAPAKRKAFFVCAREMATNTRSFGITTRTALIEGGREMELMHNATFVRAAALKGPWRERRREQRLLEF